MKNSLLILLMLLMLLLHSLGKFQCSFLERYTIIQKSFQTARKFGDNASGSTLGVLFVVVLLSVSGSRCC
jgi:hypothetical protein